MSARLSTAGKAALIALAVGVVAGMMIEYSILKPKPSKIEPAAPAVRQQDNSLVLERKPDANPIAAHILPMGAKLERKVQVTVQPSAVATDPMPGSSPEDKGIPAGATPCPPVRVDLSLVRMSDATRRVVASSPDGEVVGGVDIPVDILAIPKSLKWSAGAVIGRTSVGTQTLGFFVDRDMGPFRLGAEVFQARGIKQEMTWTAQIKAGIRF